jgi:hypothetical protein
LLVGGRRQWLAARVFGLAVVWFQNRWNARFLRLPAERATEPTEVGTEGKRDDASGLRDSRESVFPADFR